MSDGIQYETRVLLCSHCGGPFEAPVAGGFGKCQYCGAVSEVRARPDRLAYRIRSGHEMSEPERWRELEAQGAGERPKFYRDAYFDYLHRAEAISKRDINGWFDRWQGALDLARENDDERMHRSLFDLTTLVAAWCENHGDAARWRAIVESAVEVPSSLRGKQLLLRLLVVDYAKRGQLDLAREWLESLDHRSADLSAHTDQLIARAVLATAEDRWDEVLTTFGGGVPYDPHEGFHIAMFVANAHHRLGDAARASRVLVEAGQAINPHFGVGHRIGTFDNYGLRRIFAHYAPLSPCRELFEVEGEGVAFVGPGPTATGSVDGPGAGGSPPGEGRSSRIRLVVLLIAALVATWVAVSSLLPLF